MKTKLITLLFLHPLLSFSATNCLYKNNEVVTYWNPPSGGMMITETNTTRKVDFLYGRNYIKSLMQLGWSTTKPDVSITSTVETKNSASPTNVFIPLTTQQWIKVLENRQTFCLVSIQNGPVIKIVLEGNVPETLYKDPPTDIERKKAIRENERNRLEKWSDNLDHRDGQIPVGAVGDPAYVDRVMNMRRQLNAEISNFNIQMRNFERNCALLDAEIEKYNRTPPTHHPKQVKAYFTGQKQDDIPIWKIVQ